MSDFLNNLGKIGMVLQAGGGSLAGRDGMAVVRDWEKQQEDARKREAISGLLAQSGIGGIQRGLLEQLPVDQQAPAILNYLQQMEAQRRAAGAAGASAARRAAEEAARARYMQQFMGGGQAPSSGGYSFGERVTDVMPSSQPLSFGRAIPTAPIEQSVLPPAAKDSWVFPSTFANADPMAGSAVAQSPALASRPVPPVMAPQETPPVPLSFGQRVAAPPRQAGLYEQASARIESLYRAGRPVDPIGASAWDEAVKFYEGQKEQFAPPEIETTDDIREYQFAVQQGYKGTLSQFIQEMRSASVPAGTPVPIGTKGEFLVPDRNSPTGYTVMAAPGSEAERARIEGERTATEADRSALENAEIQVDTVTNTIKEIRDISEDTGLFDLPEFGILGGAMARWGINQEAVDVGNKIASLESAVAFDRLQRMREASPTGGALGAVSERELTLLAADLGSLRQTSSEAEFMKVLNRVERRYTNIMRKFSAYPGASEFGMGAADDPLGLR